MCLLLEKNTKKLKFKEKEEIEKEFYEEDKIKV